MGLVVEKISKSFGEIKVFEKLSFEVPSGKVFCIQGKSGEGKTTLLRCLNRLEQLDEGRVLIDGENILEMKENRKIGSKIGLVFQNYNLFPHLTVMEN